MEGSNNALLQGETYSTGMVGWKSQKISVQAGKDVLRPDQISLLMHHLLSGSSWEGMA